jgi:cytochrome c-type biogenesis protein CcmH/NrfG
VIERAAVVIVAVAAIALLVAGYGAARAEDDLFNFGIRHPKPTAADAAHAKALASRAGRATPGQRRTLLLAPVLGRAGETDEAVRRLEAAVKAEPENAEAWLLLSRAAKGEVARRAAQRVRELAPPVPDPPS